MENDFRKDKTCPGKGWSPPEVSLAAWRGRDTRSSRAGTRPAWPRHRIPATVAHQQQTFSFATSPVQTWGWLGFGSPLLVTPLAAAPWGWCPQWVQLRSQRLPHHQIRAGLPDPSFSVPLLDMEGFHDAKLNQEKPVRGLKLVPGEAFPHGV